MLTFAYRGPSSRTADRQNGADVADVKGSRRQGKNAPEHDSTPSVWYFRKSPPEAPKHNA